MQFHTGLSDEALRFLDLIGTDDLLLDEDFGKIAARFGHRIELRSAVNRGGAWAEWNRCS